MSLITLDHDYLCVCLSHQTIISSLRAKTTISFGISRTFQSASRSLIYIVERRKEKLDGCLYSWVHTCIIAYVFSSYLVSHWP